MRKIGFLLLILIRVFPLLADRIHEVAMKGDIELIKNELAKGVDINLQDKQGCSLIVYAIANNQVKAVDFLLHNGANPNLKTKAGDTALFFAVINGNRDITDLLLDSKVNINEKNNLGETVLMQAARAGYTDIVRKLISKGAAINARDNDQGNALMRAAFKGYNDIVLQLLKKGADLKIKNSKSKSAKDFALENGNNDTARLLDDWQKNPQIVINKDRIHQRQAPHGEITYKLIDLNTKKEISKGALQIKKINIETENSKTDDEIYFEDRYFVLFDDFIIGQSNYGKKDRDDVCGFGMWLKRLNDSVFSWEWYEQKNDNLFDKLQGNGKVRVEYRKRDGYFEISKITFIGDQIFRARKRIGLLTLLANPDKDDWNCIILDGSYINF